MKKILLSTILASTLVVASEYKYEITPMIGGNLTEGNISLEDNFANAGLAFGFNTDTFFDQVEIGFLRSLENVDYDSSTTSTKITRYFTNIVKNYSMTEDVTLYALAGVGYEQFSNEGLNNEDSAFGNYGFGLKYNISDNFALKTDLRHLIETDHGDNNLLYNVGFAYAFGETQKATPVKEEMITLITQEETVAYPKDSDNDGVYDDKDKCPNTTAGLMVNADGCTLLVDLKINFDVNSANITNQYNERIEEFANLLNKDTKLKATINAHTDSDGSTKYNQVLSEKRAQAAVEALKELNVDENRLTAKGFGESEPIASNETTEGKAQNRRVTATLERIK